MTVVAVAVQKQTMFVTAVEICVLNVRLKKCVRIAESIAQTVLSISAKTVVSVCAV